jgi:hypothetical protein
MGKYIAQAEGEIRTYFQAIAKPHAGSMNRLEKTAKDPATGNTTASSPRACTVQNNMIPMRPYAMTRDAGPPLARAEPEPTNKPVPASQRFNN